MSVGRRAANQLAVIAAVALALALALAGCGRGSAANGGDGGGGSTLRATWEDPRGVGALQRGPGEPLRDRTDLAPAAPATGMLAQFAQIADPHVRDAESPARVPFLDRLGGSFASTFRPQETLTTQTLAATVTALDRMPLDAVVETGDLIDNDQANELTDAVTTLRGGRVAPDSGAPGYDGPQRADDPDPFYYRPDVDPPRHPGMLAAAMEPFTSPGLRAPWYPLVGNHDVLVQGIVAPTPTTRAAAVGDRALWEPPAGIKVPHSGSAANPDFTQLPAATAQALLARANVHVPADPRRRELTPVETVATLMRASGHGATDGPWLQYAFDIGPHVRAIALDLVQRSGGSHGVVGPAQLAFLRRQLAAAGDRWVVVFSHQPLAETQGGEQALALLDRDPRVVAAINGDTHHNRITPHPSAAGGYWLISTCSIVDYPQQARAFALRSTRGGGIELDTWMVDHDDGPRGLARTSRDLAYLDAQGGRPNGFAGAPADRNARLFKAAPR